MKLYIHIDTNTGFQFNGDVVIPDGDLFDPASHQCFLEFCKVGSLLCDIILQVIDPLYLLVSCGSVDSGLLTEFSKPEYFIVKRKDNPCKRRRLRIYDTRTERK